MYLFKIPSPIRKSKLSLVTHARTHLAVPILSEASEKCTISHDLSNDDPIDPPHHPSQSRPLHLVPISSTSPCRYPYPAPPSGNRPSCRGERLAASNRHPRPPKPPRQQRKPLQRHHRLHLMCSRRLLRVCLRLRRLLARLSRVQRRSWALLSARSVEELVASLRLSSVSLWRGVLDACIW